MYCREIQEGGIQDIGVTQRHGTWERKSGFASDLGTPSFCAISTCMTFDPMLTPLTVLALLPLIYY